mmetsp:Transcript_22797/g.73355  ORF Transcript_22797/g.73355 Transcript_22797/m.73355 type:complete len:364 (+) Transcript_22797:170-1261(+)
MAWDAAATEGTEELVVVHIAPLQMPYSDGRVGEGLAPVQDATVVKRHHLARSQSELDVVGWVVHQVAERGQCFIHEADHVSRQFQRCPRAVVEVDLDQVAFLIRAHRRCLVVVVSLLVDDLEGDGVPNESVEQARLALAKVLCHAEPIEEGRLSAFAGGLEAMQQLDAWTALSVVEIGVELKPNRRVGEMAGIQLGAHLEGLPVVRATHVGQSTSDARDRRRIRRGTIDEGEAVVAELREPLVKLRCARIEKLGKVKPWEGELATWALHEVRAPQLGLDAALGPRLVRVVPQPGGVKLGDVGIRTKHGVSRRPHGVGGLGAAQRGGRAALGRPVDAKPVRCPLHVTGGRIAGQAVRVPHSLPG